MITCLQETADWTGEVSFVRWRGFGFEGAFILELAGTIEPDATMANARRGRSYLRRISRRLTLSRRSG